MQKADGFRGCAEIENRRPAGKKHSVGAEHDGARRFREAGWPVDNDVVGVVGKLGDSAIQLFRRTAKGFVFISLEDETGVSNAIVTPQLFERYRLLISEEPFLVIEGVMQNAEKVIHVKARRIEALQFRELALPVSHDFR